MKLLALISLFLGMFITASSGYRGNDFYQVISAHPHDLEEISPHIETVYQKGRIWVVQLKKTAPSHILTHLRPLSGGEKAYRHEILLTSEIKWRKNDPIRPMVKLIDQDNIREDVVKFSSFKTRAVGTPENKEVIELVEERFKQLGYEVSKLCLTDDNCSVVADKKGSVIKDKVSMIMAHIDSVGADFAGADDNASGAAVLLEVARVVSTYENKKTVRFLVTNGEEQGLLGAADYVRVLRQEKRLSELELVINMDMVGYNENGVVDIETNPEFEGLARWQSTLAHTYTKLKPQISLGAWGSDHVPFLRRGVPALMVIENWETKTPCYHLSCDLPDTLNYEYTAEIAKLNLAAILKKDQI